MIPDTIESSIKNAYVLLHVTQDAAQLEAEILLAFTLNKPRSYLRAWPQNRLEKWHLNRYRQYIERRAHGEPIAYILGSREFWSLELKVTPDTLIPRPETERLVELALEKIPNNSRYNLADLGTGSGAIALALAKERPLCHIIATDASPQAIDVAKFNRNRHTLTNVKLIQSHWFDQLKDMQNFDIIVSNPPYIASDDPHLQQGDLPYEPMNALVSGPEGLNDIHQIITGSAAHLIPGGWLLLEHGYDQGQAVRQLLNKHGYDEIQCIADYAHNERVSMGRLSL